MSKKEPLCPLLKKPCIEHECMWYAHVVGKDPQTQKDLDHWDCAVRWLPIMMTEGARQTRGVQAAVESFRNESITRQDEALQKQDDLNTTLVATKILPALNGIKSSKLIEG